MCFAYHALKRPQVDPERSHAAALVAGKTRYNLIRVENPETTITSNSSIEKDRGICFTVIYPWL